MCRRVWWCLQVFWVVVSGLYFRLSDCFPLGASAIWFGVVAYIPAFFIGTLIFLWVSAMEGSKPPGELADGVDLSACTHSSVAVDEVFVRDSPRWEEADGYGIDGTNGSGD